MRSPLSFLRDRTAAIAAEFALVLPIMILFLLGIMDVGYYAWAINQGEKATQMGARFAVATDIVPSGLASYSFASDGGIPQGTVVSATAFPGLICTSTACTCKGQSCAFGTTRNGTAFTNIVNRMRRVKPDITEANVRIDYDWSGLGYSGDPNGPDVAPIVTVRLVNMQHRPLYGILIGSVDLPDFAYSLTAEDSEGTFAH